MKKPLLVMMGLIPAFALAQTKTFVQVSPQMNQALPVVQPRQLLDIAPLYNPGNPALFAKKSNSYGVSFIEVGNTFYDLQSNASSTRRVYVHSDGSVSVTWTTAPDGNTGFSLRGSGYNHFDGTNWLKGGTGNSERIENVRTGWPSLGAFSDGSEWIVGHDATAGGFRVSKNGSKGSTTWTTSANVLTYPNGQRPIWNRAANNGNTIHLLANFSDSSSPGDPRVITLNGVRGPMTYSRSLDGGTTWDKNNTLLPGYDSTRTVGGGGDNYAIDVRGNTVAIVAGGLADDVMVWKSIDNGETFTRIIADSFPYAPFSNSKLALDTPATNDGTVDVLIDNNGDVHVFWGYSRILNDDTMDDGSYSFFPASAQLMYWNETSATSRPIAGIVDENGNNVLDVQPGTWAGLVSGAIPGNVASVARTGNTSLVTMPSSGIDGQGRLFVVYSAPRELDVNIDDLNYRDVYIIYSTDNGATWSDPQNVSQAQQAEDAFPTIAKRVDDFVHLQWQQDEIPGTNLQNNAQGGNNHPVVDNKILYAAIPVTKIVNNEIGQGPGVGINERGLHSEIFRVHQNYPNPFTGETTVLVYMTEEAPVSLTVTNLMGQVVMQLDLGTFQAGNNEIVIDGSSLSGGIYHYTLSTGTHSVSNKMMVK